MKKQESQTTKLEQSIIVLRRAFMAYRSAKGHLEREFADVAEALQEAGRGGELANDSVTRMLGLMHDQSYHEDAVQEAIDKLYQGTTERII